MGLSSEEWPGTGEGRLMISEGEGGTVARKSPLASSASIRDRDAVRAVRLLRETETRRAWYVQTVSTTGPVLPTILDARVQRPLCVAQNVWTRLYCI